MSTVDLEYEYNLSLSYYCCDVKILINKPIKRRYKQLKIYIMTKYLEMLKDKLTVKLGVALI